MRRAVIITESEHCWYGRLEYIYKWWVYSESWSCKPENQLQRTHHWLPKPVSQTVHITGCPSQSLYQAVPSLVAQASLSSRSLTGCPSQSLKPFHTGCPSQFLSQAVPSLVAQASLSSRSLTGCPSQSLYQAVPHTGCSSQSLYQAVPSLVAQASLSLKPFHTLFAQASHQSRSLTGCSSQSLPQKSSYYSKNGARIEMYRKSRKYWYHMMYTL